MSVQYLVIVSFTLIACSQAQLLNFTNPILDTPVTHPSIFKVNDFYYLTVTGNQNTEIHVLKSKYLTNFRYVEKKVVYKVNVGYSQIESPRMQEVDGDLYLYFAMRNESVSQRMHAMKAVDPQNPMGRWRAPKRLLENIWSLTSIHGTVMKQNGRNYFVWTSLHPVASTRHISIAAMISPTVAVEPIVSLKEPMAPWECQGYCSNEYPSFIYNGGSAYMIFSASASNHPDHCLSFMKIAAGRDPMNPLNWQVADEPVFTRDDAEGVYATGHSTFTSSSDDTEVWMVYQGSESNTTVGVSLLPRVEKIEWHATNGNPIFPTPHGLDNPQPRPSGEPEMFTNPVIDEGSPHPSVIRLDGFYYLVLETNGDTEFTILKSSTLTNFRGAERNAIFIVPEGFRNIRTPRLHVLDGQLYIYFGMRDATNIYRPYVISALNPNDPLANWSGAKRILQNIWDGQYIFGSVLTTNDRLYFAWSHEIPVGNESIQGISIAQMENPGEVSPPVVLLRRPKENWECVVRCANTAPVFMYNNGFAYMVFTTGTGGDPGHSLSYMSIESRRDPLDVANWLSAPGLVFTRNDAEEVYGPVHAGFTTSPNGNETWLIHTASANTTHPFHTARIEKIEWDLVDGTPIFPRPHGSNNPQPIPN